MKVKGTFSILHLSLVVIINENEKFKNVEIKV